MTYGAVQDGYKEYLMTMNKWMKEGLVDLDLLALTGVRIAAKITNGTAGASFAILWFWFRQLDQSRTDQRTRIMCWFRHPIRH